jgi:caspase domain-containing protein
LHSGIVFGTVAPRIITVRGFVHHRITDITRSIPVVLLVALLGSGCDKIGYTRAALPDMGPQLPMSVTLSFDPSLVSAQYTYTDSCSHPGIPVLLGQVLESALTDAADQTFKTVHLAGKQSGEMKSDVNVQIVLQQQGFKMYPAALYDRVPAELLLEALVIFRDASGKVLREAPLKVTHRDRLFLSVDQKRCDYLMDPFVQAAAVSVATLFAKASRDLLDPTGQMAGGPAPALAFKTAVLDENGNALLEGGERVKVRVDLTNSGKTPITGIVVTLGGTSTFVAYFSVPTLVVDVLQPGESRSVEFTTTLPQSLEGQRAEVAVSVRVASGSSVPAAQTVTAALRGGGRFDSVDQVPAHTGLQRPHTYVLAAGISTYRDPQIASRKYASLDAELISTYFQTVGGVPAANVRLLQDWKVLRSDIEDFILEWLPRRMTSDSVVIVYFSGQAAVSPSGETYLIPYDGKHNSTARLYPLKDLETGLARLKTKHTLFIFDGRLLSIGPAGTVKRRAPRWGTSKSPVLHLIGTTGFRNGLEPVKLRHGLFTYYVLRGLKGEADANADGDVTLGELTTFVEKTVPTVAKQKFNQEQRPFMVPPILPTSKSAGLLLTKSAAR